MSREIIKKKRRLENTLKLLSIEESVKSSVPLVPIIFLLSLRPCENLNLDGSCIAIYDGPLAFQSSNAVQQWSDMPNDGHIYLMSDRLMITEVVTSHSYVYRHNTRQSQHYVTDIDLRRVVLYKVFEENYPEEKRFRVGKLVNTIDLALGTVEHRCRT